ncbi:MAG: hypothetical protein K8J08_06695 [Thermoanaerobaculia bacterium]|nr:hypothetical protein [Thermoanaerobaculia bacterium]
MTIERRFVLVTVFMAAVLASSAAGAKEGNVDGTLWYQAKDNGTRIEQDFVDGVVVVDELQGGERVKVVLIAQTIDRQEFLDALDEKGNPLFAAMSVGLDAYTVVDLCRSEDGSSPEVCGLHVHDDGVSSSKSGFGVFDHWVESLRFDDNEVEASLKTTKPEEEFNATYGFDLSFTLPIHRPAAD